MQILILSFLILSTTSCANFAHRDNERATQSKIVSSLSQRAPDFASCAKSNKLFKHLKADRIRSVISLTLNAKGQIDSFKLDKQKYPDAFSECVFKIVDLIQFPKLEENQLIELEQPFIFVKK